MYIKDIVGGCVNSILLFNNVIPVLITNEKVVEIGKIKYNKVKELIKNA